MATQTATLVAPPARRTSARRPNYIRTTPRRTRKSVVLTIVMAVFVIYSIVPLLWLLMNATKDQADLFSTFGLWFGSEFNLWQDIVDTLTYRDGIFVQWFGNTLLYVIGGAGGATLLATVAGYGMAKYDFPGRRAVFAVVLGAIAIPGTALAVPTFLMFS